MDHTGKEAEAAGVLVSCPLGSFGTGRPAGTRGYSRPTAPGRGGEEASSQTRPRAGPAAPRPTLRSDASILETGSTASEVPLSSPSGLSAARACWKGRVPVVLCFVIFAHSGSVHFVLGE